MLKDESLFERTLATPPPLPHVTKLEFAPNPNDRSDNNGIRPYLPISLLNDSLPNVSEVHIGHGVSISFDWLSLGLAAWPLTCLVLDDCCLLTHAFGRTSVNREEFYECLDTDFQYLLRQFQQLERLSIKRTTCRLFSYNQRGESQPAEPIPQETLIHMVHRYSPLRWLRSDLSEETVAMLQQERPEITFVFE